MRRAGDEALGERCEVKNLNSVRSVARAVRHEAARHRALIRAGGVVRRQTRSFDPATGTTAALRDKEALLDYRFAPEPDLPPVVVSDARLARIRDDTPELPTVAKARLCDPAGPHALRPELAEALTSRPEGDGVLRTRLRRGARVDEEDARRWRERGVRVGSVDADIRRGKNTRDGRRQLRHG